MAIRSSYTLAATVQVFRFDHWTLAVDITPPKAIGVSCQIFHDTRFPSQEADIGGAIIAKGCISDTKKSIMKMSCMRVP
jgi:hypothetical protein